MITQKSIIEMMERYQETPEAAEAAYLAAKELRPENINDNLQSRYGSSQGYAQFKQDLLEASEFDETYVESGHGAYVGLRTEDAEERLDRITATDVDVALDQVIRDAFTAKVADSLREDIRDNLPTLSQDAKTLALILRKARDMGLWDDAPDTDMVWTIYSLLSEETLTDLAKQDLKDELIRSGVIYDKSGDILLTPVFIRLEDPYGHFPHIGLHHTADE